MDNSATNKEERKYRITPFQQMISTCTGALITSTIVTPLDVVKIRLQSQQKALLSNRCFLYCNGLMDHICECANGQTNTWVKRSVPHYTSTIDAFAKIIRSEGVLSLWSGLPPTLLMAVPATIVYFVTYEQLRVWIHDKYTERTGNPWQPLWIPLMSGAVARTWAVTVVNPLELVRTKMQSKKLTYKEVCAAGRSLMESRGISGFWLGWSPTIMRDVPFSAFNWTCTFIVTKSFPKVLASLGLSAAFLAFAVISSVGLVFILACVPETQGQSLEDIERNLARPFRRVSSTANLKPFPMST